MKWHKEGVIFIPEGKQAWAKSHAMLPTPELIDDRIRIYFSSLDEFGIGRATYIDVSAANPKHVLHVEEKPVLDIGSPGAFDDNGIVPTSVLTLADGCKYLYYVGFELGTKVPYRLLTGVAQSKDQGKTFQRVKQTPILERSHAELYFRCGPFVMFENGVYKIWYVAGSEWLTINSKAFPIYTIRYLESKDGLTWGSEGVECFPLADSEHGFGRPYVIKENGLYKMFYSIRFKKEGYRLGYAESHNGINWQRKDHEMGLDISDESFENEAICYSAVLKVHDRTLVFYNGNQFGKTGICYAYLEQ